MNVLLVVTRKKEDSSTVSEQEIENLNIHLDSIESFYCQKYQDSIEQAQKMEDQKKALVADMKEAIVKVQEKDDAILLIDSFEALERNIPSIEVLNKSKVPFRVLDFPNLTMYNIDLLRQLLNYQSTIKGKKIAEGLKARRQGGGTIGNPTISSQRNIDKATYRRKDLAYTNEANTIARLKIADLREQEMNFNQIAHHLNDANLKTRRGGKFHAKGVERLFDMQTEISERFAVDDNQEPLIDVLRKTSENSELLTQIYNYKNYQDQIYFKINSPSEEATFRYTIRDNKRTIVYEGQPEQTDDTVTIEVGEALLLPGIYYLEVTCTDRIETTRVYRAFYIKKEVLGKN
ncbi:MAG: DUF1735 domain-containing protein [Bacteroidota bacterium]